MRRHKRKRGYPMYSKRTIILIIALFCSLFFGLGYSLLGTSLDLSGIISIKKYDQTLYGVLEKDKKNNNYVSINTSNHNDSFTIAGTKNVYYYRGDSRLDEESANYILNRWNVIFADHCWQMYRTTDTGGVKLIYNGEAENNQCLTTRGKHVGYNNITTKTMLDSYYYGSDYEYDKTNNLFFLTGTLTTGSVPIGSYTCMNTSSTGTCSTLYLVNKSNGLDYDAFILNGNSHYSEYGKSQYNNPSNSISYSGYMYNKIYTNTLKYYRSTSIYSYLSAPSTGYYSSEISYNNGTYTLENATVSNWADIYQNSQGFYTCSGGSSTTCNYVYYILKGSSSGYYAFALYYGHDYDYYDVSFNLGDDITLTGDGKYALNNVVSVKKSEYVSSFFMGKYYCQDGSVVCADPMYISYTGGNFFYSSNDFNNYLLANDYIYENGTYTLSGDSIVSKGAYNSAMDSYRYTCFDTSGVCNTLYYFYYSYSGSVYFFPLKDGKNVLEEVNESLYSDDVNTYDSLAKFAAEAWYKKYLLAYNSYIDDVIFHSCRSISLLGCLDGDLNRSTNFRSDIICSDEKDQFSVSNSKARLNYPIGYLTYLEQTSINSDLARSTGNSYWTMTPSYFSSGVEFKAISNTGYPNFNTGVSSTNGLRFVIALKPGTEYSSGTGSMADPFIVNTN